MIKEIYAYRLNSANTEELAPILASPSGRGAPKGRRGRFPLSVTTFGRDSSPRGRAKLNQVDKH